MGKMRNYTQVYTDWNWQVIVPIIVAVINIWPAILLWNASRYKHWFYFLLIGILLSVGLLSYIKQRWIYIKVIRIINTKRLSDKPTYFEMA